MQLTLPRGPRGSPRRDWPSRCQGNRNDPPHRGGALRSAEGPQLSFAAAASHESSTRSLGVLLGAEENLKRSAVLLPRTTFPRGLLGPNLFSAKSRFLRAVGYIFGFSALWYLVREGSRVGLVPFDPGPTWDWTLVG